MLQLTVALDSEPVLLKHVHVGTLHEVVELLAAVDTLDLGVEVTNRYVPTPDHDAFELEWVITLYDEAPHDADCEL
jgi:hypothetical protein